jgi:hypothetical protein
MTASVADPSALIPPTEGPAQTLAGADNVTGAFGPAAGRPAGAAFEAHLQRANVQASAASESLASSAAAGTPLQQAKSSSFRAQNTKNATTRRS